MSLLEAALPVAAPEGANKESSTKKKGEFCSAR